MAEQKSPYKTDSLKLTTHDDVGTPYTLAFNLVQVQDAIVLVAQSDTLGFANCILSIREDGSVLLHENIKLHGLQVTPKRHKIVVRKSYDYLYPRKD